ncbi:hypothetical protein PA6761_05376 [Pseudomonas aeruginosa]
MALTLLKNTAGADLGAASPVAVPLGEPVAQTRAYAVERTDQVETGIWECTPGRWRRQIVEQEFCHFLQGRCTFTRTAARPSASRPAMPCCCRRTVLACGMCRKPCARAT